MENNIDGTIEAARRRFADYIWNACHRHADDLPEFERHGFALAYRLEVPAKDATNFLDQFGGSINAVRAAWGAMVLRNERSPRSR
jgi:hypothetical protein